MKKKILLLLSVLIIIANISSCATSTALTTEGKNVQYKENGNPPKDAIYLDTIQTKNNDSAVSAVNDLRNKTAELGGNYLIVDMISSSIKQNIIT